MHILWKIFGVSFELLAHNHVKVGAQSRQGWRTSFRFWWLAQHQMFKRDFEY
jgi:hypothetical protein